MIGNELFAAIVSVLTALIVLNIAAARKRRRGARGRGGIATAPGIVTPAELRRMAAAQGLKYDTPLQAAVTDGNIRKVRRLLRNGADPNEISGMQVSSPLTLALKNVAMFDLLLEHGADINLQDKMDFTSLMVAAMNGDSDAAKRLIEHGADPDVIAPPNWKAWMHAQARGHKDLSEYLRSLSSDAD
ncbi:MAG: ankyrin repeat domain-containing protein [Capsulimonadaceae bacterium]